MFRCSIRNFLWLILMLPLFAGATGADKSAWQQFAQCQTITGLAFDDSVLWIGTGECGLARLSPSSGQISFLTNQNSGLPSNGVSSLAIDRGRVLWIGTGEGLAAFDGRAWRVFRTDNAPFPSNDVTCVALDSGGGVWVGFSKGGVLLYSHNVWTNLLEEKPGFPLTLASHVVLAIAPVNGHDAWISWNPSIYTDSYYLAFLDENGWHTYGYMPGRAIAVDKDGAVWFPDDQWITSTHVYGLNRFRYPDSLTFYSAYPSIVPSNIYYFTALAIDGAGRKWTGAGNFVACLTGTEFSRPPFVDGTPTFGFGVLSFAFDKAGTAWAGFTVSSNGPLVAALVGDTVWTRYTVRGSSIPYNGVRFVCPMADGAWIGSDYGIARLRSGQWEVFPQVDTVYGVYYNGSICPDGHGGLWIVKRGRFIHGDGQSWKVFLVPSAFDPISIFADAQGLIWARMSYSSQRGYSLVAFDTLMNIIEEKDSLPSVSGMTQATDGTLWTAFSNDGLLCRAPDGSWTRVTAANSNLASDSLNGVLAGPDGKLWVGTKNRGLCCLSNGRWTAYDTLNSEIPGQGASPLCIDSSGNLWLLAGGLVKYDGQAWTLYTTINSGVPSNNVYAAAAGDSGRVWVGTSLGLALFDYKNASAAGRTTRPHFASVNNGISILIRGGVVILQTASSKIMSVQIVNTAGRLVYLKNQEPSASQKTMITLPVLQSGFYVARMVLMNGDGRRVVEQRKFVVPGR